MATSARYTHIQQHPYKENNRPRNFHSLWRPAGVNEDIFSLRYYLFLYVP